MQMPSYARAPAALIRNPDPTWWWVGGAVAASGLVLGGALLLRARARRPREYPWPEPQPMGVPFAEGHPRPVWPVASNSRNPRRLEVAYRDIHGERHGNGSRRFRTTRGGGRYHIGIDLYANAGDVVLAPESGTIVQLQTFLSGTDAMLLQGDHGVTLLLGEIKPGSWKEFGLAEGSRVKQGDPVARVGLTHNGSHMLHFEAYSCCPIQNQHWYAKHGPDENVRDPTDYLLRALAGEVSAV